MYFSSMYRLHDIAGRSSARGRQTRVGENKLFSHFMPQHLENRTRLRLKLLLMTNRKLHMRLRLAPKSIIFDNLEPL